MDSNFRQNIITQPQLCLPWPCIIFWPPSSSLGYYHMTTPLGNYTMPQICLPVMCHMTRMQNQHTCGNDHFYSRLCVGVNEKRDVVQLNCRIKWQKFRINAGAKMHGVQCAILLTWHIQMNSFLEGINATDLVKLLAHFVLEVHNQRKLVSD